MQLMPSEPALARLAPAALAAGQSGEAASFPAPDVPGPAPQQRQGTRGSQGTAAATAAVTTAPVPVPAPRLVPLPATFPAAPVVPAPVASAGAGAVAVAVASSPRTASPATTAADPLALLEKEQAECRRLLEELQRKHESLGAALAARSESKRRGDSSSTSASGSDHSGSSSSSSSSSGRSDAQKEAKSSEGKECKWQPIDDWQLACDLYREQLDMVARDEYEVDEIFAVRQRGGSKEYRIKWLGYPDSSNTWEPEENVPEGLRADFEARQQQQQQRRSLIP
jgi:hypothetical protein